MGATDPAERPIHPRLRALVVDDHPTNRFVLELILARIQAEVVFAEDGRQALEAAALQSFDVVFMDLEMPVMGGLEATRALRGRERDQDLAPALIVIVSGHAYPQHIDDSLSAGADLHLVKPVKPETILAALERVSHRPEALSASGRS